MSSAMCFDDAASDVTSESDERLRVPSIIDSLTSYNTSDNGTSSAWQIALSSSLDASLRPRSTS